MTLAAVARISGVSVDSLKRHRASGHVVGVASFAPPSPAPVHEAAAGVSLPVTSPAETYDALSRALAEMMASASPSMKVDIIAEQRRLAESRARAVGPAPSAKVRVEDVDGWLSTPEREGMSDVIFRALEPHPDARRDLVRALDEWAQRDDRKEG